MLEKILKKKETPHLSLSERVVLRASSGPIDAASEQM